MLIFTRIGSRKMFMRKILILLSLTGLLSACGLKGPLYLPGQKPGATPPATAPAADTDAKKSPDAAKP